MSTPRAGPERRLCRRRPARGRIRISCYKGTLDLGANLAMSLLDVSESGIRLLLKAPLDAGQEVCLGLEGQGHLRPVKRTGRVAWCLPAAGGFQVGINLAHRIDYSDVFKLT